jgi:poly-beta-1,6-N-acetyl-D-glucosamine N-deacetylase
VLLYHRLAPSTNGYGVAPAVFDAEMQRLHELGFEAITLDQYVRFIRGVPVDLPPRPFLLTFDDANISAWQNADPVLARYGWSASMYVPTLAVGKAGHLTWDDLRQMQASGRWQIDEHSGDGHVLITVDAAGRQAPYYANELWANGRLESFAHYKERVSGDVEHGLTLLARNIPGWSSHGSFAVPYNNYGQNGSNDPRIAPWLADYLRTHFGVIFVQRDDSFSKPGQPFANRIGVFGSWDAQTLVSRLLHGRQISVR